MYILTHRSLIPSARALANQLGSRLGITIPVMFENSERTARHKSFIRWGNSGQVETAETQFNSAEMIFTSSNKLRFSKEMVRLGIPCVEINTGMPTSFPVVIRKVLSGCGGEGIEICHTKEEFISKHSGRAWSNWYNLSPELGVHIFEGRIMKIFKKMRIDDLPEEKFPIRNLSRGYKFSRVSVENYPKLVPAMADFAKKFPIKFGRVDIGWDSASKTYRIIEMNTAPGIATNTDTLSSYVAELEAAFRRMR